MMFRNNVDFYPTPKEVIDTMMLGEEVFGKVVLEPSAGSGNIVHWLKQNGAQEVFACETDPHLIKLLQGTCSIIGDDFLKITAEQISHVDYIVMNPPFSRGAEHILHAYSIAPAGCTIVALCNTNTISNVCYESRKELRDIIDLYGYSENIGCVFDYAERQTHVNVSLVKLYKEGVGDDEFAGYIFTNEQDALNANTEAGLVRYNFVREIVNRYITAVQMFDDVMEASEAINEAAVYVDHCKKRTIHDYAPIRFMPVDGRGNAIDVSRGRYKKELQKYYWKVIFDKMELEKYSTQGLREQINKFVERQVSVPFTMKNIYSVVRIIVQTTGQRMRKAIEEAFDTICSFSADNCSAGEKWKTNSNYMVNRKFIVPYITEYDTRWNSYSVQISCCAKNVYRINDVCKALCYLTGADFNDKEDIYHTCYKNKYTWGEWFEWGFFRCKAFKKGTMHFEFLDEKVWYKFNQVVAESRGWELPTKKARKREDREK